ncbi:hypothetical protein R6Q59_034226 [Mikania micrantha]
MALYDLAAVLLPGGPLQLLVELAISSDEDIPALVYEARPIIDSRNNTTVQRRVWRDRRANPESQTSPQIGSETIGSSQNVEEGHVQELSVPLIEPVGDHGLQPENLGLEGIGLGSLGAIKLGLGDFIFYSVLVGRAAMYDFMTVYACYLTIIAGLGSTLILLALYQKALPALPVSVILGVLFYVLTRCNSDQIMDGNQRNASILHLLGEEIIRIITPVSICMSSVVILVPILDTDSSISSSISTLASIAYTESTSDSTWDKFKGALLNSLVFVVVVTVVTFLLVLLFYFNCTKFLRYYMGLSAFLVLGFMGGEIGLFLIQAFRIAIDCFTYVLLLLNFEIVGVLAVFMSKIPIFMTQSYMELSVPLIEPVRDHGLEPENLGLEGIGLGSLGAIKLGLGDFIFYSVLVGRAAMYDFMTVYPCYLAIIAGLGTTLILLAFYQKALPALPVSVILGVLFYVLTRVFLEEFIIQCSLNLLMF